MYLGDILMGDAQTRLEVVYDTGSDWLVIPDITCSNCDGTVHDNSFATKVDENITERLYGSAALEGRTYSDKVCLNSE